MLFPSFLSFWERFHYNYSAKFFLKGFRTLICCLDLLFKKQKPWYWASFWCIIFCVLCIYNIKSRKDKQEHLICLKLWPELKNTQSIIITFLILARSLVWIFLGLKWLSNSILIKQIYWHLNCKIVNCKLLSKVS